MNDVPSSPEVAGADPKPVMQSRIAAALGGLSFAIVVTVVTWIFRSDRTVQPGMVPLLTFAVFGGMGAVLLGMFGVAIARRLLVPGILLGLLGVLTGGITALSAPLVIWSIKQYQAMQMAEPAIQATKQWIRLVGAGDIAAAKSLSSDAIDEVRLTEAFEQIQTFGAIQKVDERFGGDARDPAAIEIQAKIDFDKGAKVVITKWDATGPAPRLTSYEFRSDPTTQATTPAKKD